jgi:hypothetical protein
MAQQMRVDTLADAGGNGDRANDLANALTRQHVRRRPSALLTAGEQRPGASRADMQAEQLRQLAADRHFPALATVALANRDHALGEADILDPELHQLGTPGAGLQQGLQQQSGAAVLGVGLIEEPKFLFDRQPVDTTTPLRRKPQTSALPGSPEHRLNLGIIDPVAREDRGNGGGGALERGHGPVCFIVSGLQTVGIPSSRSARIAACRDAGPAPSLPLRLLWKAHLPAVHDGRTRCT